MRTIELNISEDKINREFEIIKVGKPDGYKTIYSWNNIILYFHWKEFYKTELKMWNENKLYHGLPLQSWIYLNRKKYINKSALDLTDREILRAFKISGIHIGNSFHSPFYIQQFIKDYNIKSIYDPCGGWNHRLLGAWDVKYIYNDINPITAYNTHRLVDYFNLKDKYIYNEDASVFTPEEDYEAVFTCPPYHDVEIYSDRGAENLSYPEFLLWWENVIKSSLKLSVKYFAFIINHTHRQDMDAVCQKYLTKINEISLGRQTYSHLNTERRVNDKQEYLLIYSH